MQTFRDSATQAIYAFEDDVVAAKMDGVWRFATAAGAPLLPDLATLVPYTPPAPTEAEQLAAAQAAQTTRLRAACEAEIVGGYSSAALGAAHTYPSTPTDQANMAASVIASLLPGLAPGWTTPFWCVDTAGVWTFAAHSAAQIQQVGRDGKAFVIAAQRRLATLSAEIAATADIAAVQAVVW
jgi:hypothetical protein